jgi:hypothetical protein
MAVPAVYDITPAKPMDQMLYIASHGLVPNGAVKHLSMQTPYPAFKITRELRKPLHRPKPYLPASCHAVHALAGQ